MNCQNFETMMGDLARGALMDASVRESALGHEASCARCAARLADRRSLAEGLRTLAATTKNAEAPVSVEENLLAAFRARAAAGTGVVGVVNATQTREPGAASAQPLNFKQWSWRKTFGTAAVAAAAAVILLMLIPSAIYVPRTERASAGSEVSQETVAPPTATPGEAIRQSHTDAGLATLAGGLAPTNNEPNQTRAMTTRPRTTARANFVQAAYNKRPANADAQRLSPREDASADAGEIVTDFMPVAHAAPLSSADGGQVVRVELPRSSLVSFGLPMNVERAGERVKADVLVGDDGMARAIRFVR
ncbi:MAG TPA: hypothetical protein VM934_15505 [Pyrinomonadaceae bacterium]|jgi:hypothetical protein|nr:hypothetical protein [Pyrinomonadaceae bacterium]